MNDFIIHACEQVLRFSRVENWSDLSEAIRVQLGFNVGVVALGLNLSKLEAYQVLVDARVGKISMNEFRNHFKSLFSLHNIEINIHNVEKAF